MTKEEFFLKTDGEIARAVTGKNKYFFLISQKIPCTSAEFKRHYSQYVIEMKTCKGCRHKEWDIIINLI